MLICSSCSQVLTVALWLGVVMRRSVLLVGVSLSAIILGSNFAGADGYQQRYGGSPPFSWSGMYIGYHVGGALDKSDVSDPFVDPVFGTSHIFGDKVRSP